MALENITIALDPEAARAYDAVPADDKKKMQALLSLWLRDLITAEPAALKQIMDEVGRKARARGLTPEVLDSLLKGV
jgi:hypothetical protein